MTKSNTLTPKLAEKPSIFLLEKKILNFVMNILNFEIAKKFWLKFDKNLAKIGKNSNF